MLPPLARFVSNRGWVGRVKLERDDRFGERLVVRVDGAVLGAAGDVVAVRGQTDKVFLVCVAREGPHAFAAVDAPHLERAVGGSAGTDRIRCSSQVVSCAWLGGGLCVRARDQLGTYAETSSSRFRNLTYDTALRWPLRTTSGSRVRRRS